MTDSEQNRTPEQVDFYEAFFSGRMSRRDAMKRLAAFGLSASLVGAFADYASAGVSASTKKKGITFSSWGGDYSEIWRKTIVDPFTKATGISVQFDDAPGEMIPKLQAQHQAGRVSWDIFEPGDPEYAQLIKMKYIQKFPPSLTKLLTKTSYAGTVKSSGVGVSLGANQVIVSLKDSSVRNPTNPADFFDVKKFPVRRGMWGDGYVDNVTSALVADGVRPAKLFPLDLDRAYKMLEAVKPAVKVWYTSGNQQQQIVRDREVDVCMMWDGRATGLKYKELLPVNLSYKLCDIQGNNLAVPTGAPNPQGGFKFLEFMAISPKLDALWEAQNGYTTANNTAWKYEPLYIKKRLWTYPSIRAQTFALDYDAIAKSEDLPAMKKRWYDFLQG